MRELDSLKQEVVEFASEIPLEIDFDEVETKLIELSRRQAERRRRRLIAASAITALGAAAAGALWFSWGTRAGPLIEAEEGSRIVARVEKSSPHEESGLKSPEDSRLAVEKPAKAGQAPELQAPDFPSASPRLQPPREKASVKEVSQQVSWRSLADSGEFDAALKAAKESDFDSVLEQSSADDLLALGEAASYAGDSESASRAFRFLVMRHAGSEQAGTATFHLARLQARRGAHSEALVLLESYLKEHPGGHLAREARGLHLEVLVETEDSRKLSAARRYLTVYPSGPHAALATKVIESAP